MSGDDANIPVEENDATESTSKIPEDFFVASLAGIGRGTLTDHLFELYTVELENVEFTRIAGRTPAEFVAERDGRTDLPTEEQDALNWARDILNRRERAAGRFGTEAQLVVLQRIYQDANDEVRPILAREFENLRGDREVTIGNVDNDLIQTAAAGYNVKPNIFQRVLNQIAEFINRVLNRFERTKNWTFNRAKAEIQQGIEKAKTQLNAQLEKVKPYFSPPGSLNPENESESSLTPEEIILSKVPESSPPLEPTQQAKDDLKIEVPTGHEDQGVTPQSLTDLEEIPAYIKKTTKVSKYFPGSPSVGPKRH